MCGRSNSCCMTACVFSTHQDSSVAIRSCQRSSQGTCCGQGLRFADLPYIMFACVALQSRSCARCLRRLPLASCRTPRPAFTYHSVLAATSPTPSATTTSAPRSRRQASPAAAYRGSAAASATPSTACASSSTASAVQATSTYSFTYTTPSSPPRRCRHSRCGA